MTFIPRKLEKRIRPLIKRNEIIGIRGPRQAGKTTLMKRIRKDIDSKTAFINMDIPENRKNFEEAPLDLSLRYAQKGENLALFIDEVQRVRNGGENLKIIYDETEKLKMFISGSSSLEIKTQILPFLVGRIMLFDLYPFDFEEYISLKDPSLLRIYKKKNKSLKRFLADNNEIDSPSYQEELLRHWKEYSVYGGYPEVAKTGNLKEKENVLKNIYNLYVEKDIVSFFHIENTTSFENFLSYAGFTLSSLFSVSNAAKSAGINFNRAQDYLGILEHSYIISRIMPFHRNMVTEIKKSPKIYFLDLGMRNCTLKNFLPFDKRSDKGAVLENAVFRQLLELKDEWNIRFWRTTGKAEVDFVLLKGDEVIPIEVKLTENKPGKSFHSFLNEYKPERAIIVTLSDFKKEKIGNTTVTWVPVHYF